MMRETLFSLAYKTVRKSLLTMFYARNRLQGKLPDLEDAVILGDRYLSKVNLFLGKVAFDFRIPDGIGVYIHDLYFPSPLTFSSFKGDFEVLEIWLRLGMGGGMLKTVMETAREGNPRPRLQEIVTNGYPGFLNAMGLPGKGVDALLASFSDRSIFHYNRPIGMSIGGNSLEEYQRNFEKVETYMTEQGIANYFYEINISCPNTPEGQQMTQHPEILVDLLKVIRPKSKAVMGIKVSPDQSDAELVSFADIMKAFDRTYINAGNAPFRTCEKVGLDPKAMSIGGGGVSGPALLKRTKEMTELLAPMGVPIMATGGVSTAEDVLYLQEKGATLVSMATAIMKDLYVIPRINRELSKVKRAG